MKRIILFRFHKGLFICENRLKLLKRYNPDIKIFGLYGGREREYGKYQEKLGPYLESLYVIRGKTARWKWLNGDLSICLWFKEFGKNISFDMVHISEWDLLMFDSMDNLYKHIPEDGIGLTSLCLIKNTGQKRFWWGRTEPYKTELKQLLTIAKDSFNYTGEPYHSWGPGACFSKKFLEAYSSIKIPELCHEEVRVPLFGQIFGFKLYDTGLSKDWSDENEYQIFNCKGDPEIKYSKIKEELRNPAGRRAFHPYKKLIILSPMDHILNLLIMPKRIARAFKMNIFRIIHRIRQKLLSNT
jgi:hypothetical protein